jgi:homoserine dehydrogenase
MAKLGNALGGHHVSIASMIQHGRHATGRADIIIVTHTAKEQDVQKAIKEIVSLGITFDEPFVLRVEEEL